VTNFVFKVNTQEIMLNDLGQSMNTEFENLYKHFLVKEIFNKMGFESESSNFFDKNDGNYGAPNAYIHTAAYHYQG
jgi:hypothetical protein